MSNNVTTPLVSIIIRTRNEEAWLKACLDAIGKQSHQNYEVIIVDNGSTDATLKILERRNIAKIEHVDQYNPSNALNRGIAVASGSICAFLSAHCVPASNHWLSDLIEPIVSNEAICAYGRQIPTRNTTADNARDLLITFGREKVIQKYDFKFHNANSAIDTEYLAQHQFDESLTNVEDWYWAANAIQRGQKIAYIPTASVFHHHGLHQHDPSKPSFRARPVAKLIRDAYDTENHIEPFFDYTNWKGLGVFSNPTNKPLPFQLGNMPLQHFIVNTNAPSTHYPPNIYQTEVAQDYDFHTFLSEILTRAEKYFDQVFDYICFADLSYSYLDPALATLNVDKLFSEWADVTCVARKITGKTICTSALDDITRSEKFPTTAGSASKAELILGQFSAIRTHVIRSGPSRQCGYKITKLITGKSALKDVTDENS